MTLCEVCRKTKSTYGFIGERLSHCADCKLDKMVRIIPQKCLVCLTTQSHFGFPGKRASHCLKCRLDGMVSINAPKCVVCFRPAVFAKPGEETASHCCKCRLDGMVNVHAKLCIVCQQKMCSFGTKGTSTASHCFDCKLPDQVDVRRKYCAVCFVKKAVYCLPGAQRPTHCKTCKTIDQIDPRQKYKTCIGCDKLHPLFGLEQDKPTHCAQCKTDEMTNVVTKRCVNCQDVLSSKNCEGNCIHCYASLFPDKPAAVTYRAKVANISTYLRTKFPTLNFCGSFGTTGEIESSDGPIETDFMQTPPQQMLDPNLIMWFDFGAYIIVVQIDENYHLPYDCTLENKQIAKLYEKFRNRPLVFIRFNCDDYLNNKTIVTSCWSKHNQIKLTKRDEWSLHLDWLRKAIEHFVNNPPTKPIRVVELYFDQKSDR